MRSVLRFIPERINTTGRSFRSDAALEAIARAREENVRNIALYNYPSFSGAFSALFAHLFHSRLNLPCLILPFSSVEPFRIEDLLIEGLERCYLLDFLGPKGFAVELCQQSSCKVRAFEHRISMLSHVPAKEDCLENLLVHYDTEKSSSMAVYEYFSAELANTSSINGLSASLLEPEDKDRIERALKYIEDADLRRWTFPDIRLFNIGLLDWRSKLNCIINPFIFEQLVKMSPEDLIARGNTHVSLMKNFASTFMDKVFKVHLGRGFYGECLGVRVDGNAHLSDELGKQLSLKSAASGLRPIGAVIYMQRSNLKMCLRSTDGATDTSEIAKAYGGGGTPSSSSFIIRMDEYNRWLAVNTS